MQADHPLINGIDATANHVENALRERFRIFPRCGPLGIPPPGREWEELMGQALLEARKAFARQETPVGALVVDPAGKILSRAGNRVLANRDPTAHAEILAIRKAAGKIGNERLCGCLMIVTLEPCFMCAAAIQQARMAGVVFGAADNHAGAFVSRAEYSALAGGKIWHLGGILSAECAEILKKFFLRKR